MSFFFKEISIEFINSLITHHNKKGEPPNRHELMAIDCGLFNTAVNMRTTFVFVSQQTNLLSFDIFVEIPVVWSVSLKKCFLTDISLQRNNKWQRTWTTGHANSFFISLAWRRGKVIWLYDLDRAGCFFYAPHQGWGVFMVTHRKDNLRFQKICWSEALW